MISIRLLRVTGAALAGVLLLAGCAGDPVDRSGLTAVPATDWYTPPVEAEPPVFRKVPPEENILVDPAPLDPGAGGPYRVEVEDVLDISIYGEVDLQHVEVPVRPDGMISFAFIGDVEAAGRTVEEIRTDMTERLAQYLRSPQVTVIAKAFGQKKVFVGGQVREPGIFYLTGREGTLIDALYKAGLTTNEAHLDGAYIMRGNAVINADFKRLVRGDLSYNVALANEDVIYVPENHKRFVYVLGEIRKNDAFELSEPIPLIDVIARAGGFLRYSKLKEIAVIRGGLKDPELAIVNARALVEGDFRQNILILPGDIIYVPLSALGKYNRFMDDILRTVTFIFQGQNIAQEFNQ